MSSASELLTAVKLRYKTATLIQLTQWDTPSATTVDDDFLLTACGDVINTFTLRQLQYDSTFPPHVTLATKMIKPQLQYNQGGAVPDQVQISYADCLATIDRLREKAVNSGGKQAGYAPYSAKANDNASRFPNRVMSLTRQPPSNPRNL